MSRRLPISSQRLADGESIPFYRDNPCENALFTNVVDETSCWGGASCTLEVIKAQPILNKVYGDSMHKVLNVGPDTCSVVPEFLKEDIEAWGVEPYDLEDASAKCKRLVRKGIVHVADIKFPLPYKANSFSLVLDALDLLISKILEQNPSRIFKACCC